MAAPILVSLIVAFVFVGTARAKKPSVLTTPPADFKEVSTLVNVPSFVPGLGMLYVNPSTLPVGPFLGYDKSGKRLVNVTYMVPIKDIDAHKNLTDLGGNLGDLEIDHTDIEFNRGHPGAGSPLPHRRMAHPKARAGLDDEMTPAGSERRREV